MPSGWWTRPSPARAGSTCWSTTPASSPSTAYFRIEDTARRGLGPHPGRQPQGHVPDVQVRPAAHPSIGARRVGHQHGQRPGAPVDAQGAVVRREQGRRPVAHPEHGARLRAGGHPGQRHLPRHHRLRAGPDGGARGGRRPRRDPAAVRRVPSAGPPGAARGHRPGRAVPGQRPLQLHDRRLSHRRWRLHGPGCLGRAAPARTSERSSTGPRRS